MKVSGFPARAAALLLPLSAFMLPAATAAAAEAAPVDVMTLVEEGTDAVPACGSCHGAGMGGSIFPHINGQDAGYIAKQLRDFRSGARSNDIMAPIAAELTDADITALADHYAAQPAAPDAVEPADADTLARGRHLAEVGAWEDGVPACRQCHGPDGVGVGAAFPGLQGQYPDYVIAQFAAWKAGDRANDPIGLMKTVAERLGDDDIAAVAAWYASLGAE